MIKYTAKKPGLYLQCEEDRFRVLKMERLIITLRRGVVKEVFLEEKTLN